MIYGYGGTFHKTNHLDIETDSTGKVVAVWFRCLTLPFEQHGVGDGRAGDMISAYKEHRPREILAIDLVDSDERHTNPTYISPASIEGIKTEIENCRRALDSLETKLAPGRMS